jgi:hypothetical protein
MENLSDKDGEKPPGFLLPTILGIIAGVASLPVAFNWTVAFYTWGSQWPDKNTAAPFLLLAWLHGPPAPGFEQFVFMILLVVSLPISFVIAVFAWIFVIGGVVLAAAGVGVIIGCVITNSFSIMEKIHYLFIPHPAATIVQTPNIDGKELADRLGDDKGSRAGLAAQTRHARELAQQLRAEAKHVDADAKYRKEKLQADTEIARAAEELEKARARRDALINRGGDRG